MTDLPISLVSDRTPPAAGASGGGRVDALEVRQHVGARQLLYEVSLSFEPGKLVAIAGGSGAGKSTRAADPERARSPDPQPSDGASHAAALSGPLATLTDTSRIGLSPSFNVLPRQNADEGLSPPLDQPAPHGAPGDAPRSGSPWQDAASRPESVDRPAAARGRRADRSSAGRSTDGGSAIASPG